MSCQAKGSTPRAKVSPLRVLPDGLRRAKTPSPTKLSTFRTGHVGLAKGLGSVFAELDAPIRKKARPGHEKESSLLDPGDKGKSSGTLTLASSSELIKSWSIVDEDIMSVSSRVTRLIFGFSLIFNGEIRHPDDDEAQTIMAAFPGCRGVGVLEPYLVVLFPTDSSLPDQPWPLSVAGAPLLVTNKASIMDAIDMGCFGKGARMTVDMPLRPDAVELATLEQLDQLYREQFDADIVRITCMGGRMEMTFKDTMPDLGRLPTNINKVLVTYRMDTHSRVEAAKRAEVPSSMVCDDTNYGKSLPPGDHAQLWII